MTTIGQALSWRSALEIVLGAASVKEVETMDMTSAVGRVLAAPIVAPNDYPLFNRSSVDGYAIRSSDVVLPPVSLGIAGTITAGAVSKLELQPGQCMKVMTGAALPPGSDAVVPFEKAIQKGTDIELSTSVQSGQYCVFQGAEFKKGTEIIPAGTSIGATEIGLMAQMGMQQIQVHKAPTVALIVTGDELVEPWVKPQPGQIQNSNAYTLLTLLRQMGVSPHYLGICPDSLPALTEKVLSGMQDNLVLVVGGSAKGDKDFLREAFSNLGVEILVDGMALKPGGTSVFARRKMCLMMGLPGPPGAMRTAFHLLVQPLLRKMMGFRTPEPTIFTGTFKGTFSKPEGVVEFFLGAKVEFRSGEFVVEPTNIKSSISWESWKSANALVHLSKETTEITDGEQVSFLLTVPLN